MPKINRLIPIALGLVGLCLLGSAVVVMAHGYGTPRVLNAATGPYNLSIWTDPQPLRSDETHVIVAVIDPQTQGLIVSEVAVTVRMSSFDPPGIELSQIAEPDSTNRLLFAAVFDGEVKPGRWLVGVSAAGALGDGDEVTFEVDITPARRFNWLWVGGVGVGLLLLIWIVSLFLRPSR
ncbi:MAG: hypothetical protein R6X18_03370 [Chloroflexota bacterium]|jgi:hypothetical protein